jgi:DNA-binding NtrC family response regulator
MDKTYYGTYNLTPMNILFVHDDPEIQEEIREFLTIPEGNVIFSKNMREAINTLNDREEIGLVVLKINSNKDASILRYINDYYKDLEVLVMASKEYDEVISTFSTGHFTLYQQPLKLTELKKNIDQIMTEKMNTAKTSSKHKHA